MIDLKKYAIFADHLSNLKETSVDDRDGRSNYMTHSNRDVVNFDAVKYEYVKDLGLCDTPKSNDALFDEGEGKLVFVEFKNGFVDRAVQYAVRKKIYDSLLIFNDITSTNISDTRQNMKFILVYNEVANQNNTTDAGIKKKTAVQPSPSFDYLAKTVGQYAGEEYVCFGLNIFKNYCFKEVHTFTETEFEAYLARI